MTIYFSTDQMPSRTAPARSVNMSLTLGIVRTDVSGFTSTLLPRNKLVTEAHAEPQGRPPGATDPTSQAGNSLFIPQYPIPPKYKKIPIVSTRSLKLHPQQ